MRVLRAFIRANWEGGIEQIGGFFPPSPPFMHVMIKITFAVGGPDALILEQKLW